MIRLAAVRSPGRTTHRMLRSLLAAADNATASWYARKVVAGHWPADTDDGALCVQCWTTWPCPDVTDQARLLAPPDRRLHAAEVHEVHRPAHPGPRTLEQCRACPVGTAWPCAHWDAAAEIIDTQGHDCRRTP